MEYSLPGPVVALLQEEKASLAPKAYYISSGKKSIKITLVYAKDQHSAPPSETDGSASTESGGHRKKPRHGHSSKQASKSARHRRKGSHSDVSVSPPSLQRNDPISGSCYHSDPDQVCSTPEFNMGSSHMSTVDSGLPPSSHPSTSGSVGSNRQVDENVSESESEGEEERGRGGERESESVCSSDSEKPRTPCREMAVAESSLGPGETPASSRDEMWQTWTRIPRSQAVHTAHKFLAAPSLPPDRRSMSPSVSQIRRSTPAPTSNPQRRPRLQEGVSWDGSGNL